MPGATAYGGIDVLRPKAEEVLWVSAAAGAVGLMVAQLAKARNVRVIGSTSSTAKLALLRRGGVFDCAFSYRGEDGAPLGPGELAARVRSCAPEGIDMYFENVGQMVQTPRLPLTALP
jgi:NADPH-dependent curcumin reductase CurA